MLTETMGFAQPRVTVLNREREQFNASAKIAELAAAGPVAIDLRLSELDEEWDVLRTLQLLTPLVSIFGISLGLSVNVSWFVLPIVTQALALQQAMQGWSLPFATLRWLGVRTEWEIDEERYALNFLLCEFAG